jgi:hypothetical protein
MDQAMTYVLTFALGGAVTVYAIYRFAKAVLREETSRAGR